MTMDGAELLPRLDARIGELIAQVAERSRLRARCAELENERSALEASLQSDEASIDRTLGRLRAIENEYRAALDEAARREQLDSDLARALAEKAGVLADLGRPVADTLHELTTRIVRLRDRVREIDDNIVRARHAGDAVNALIQPLESVEMGATLDVMELDIVGVPMKHLAFRDARAHAQVAAAALAHLREHLARTSTTLAAGVDEGPSAEIDRVAAYQGVFGFVDLLPVDAFDWEAQYKSYRWRKRAQACVQQILELIRVLNALERRCSAELQQAETIWRDLVRTA